MKVKNIIIVIICLIISGILTYLFNYRNISSTTPREAYRIYLNGETIGLINSKDELDEYINKQQDRIKKKYNVDTIYVPNEIKVIKDITYDDNINSVENIYKKINSISPFTIKGYEVVIDRTNSTEYKNDDNSGNNNEKIIKLYLLKKDILEDAVENVVLSFVDDKQYKAFINDEQLEIITTGSLIENIYIEDKITVKETNIPVDASIFVDDASLTKYLIFGENESNKIYKVKANDSIDSIAEKNKMSVNELLIANQSLQNENTLLYEGQELSIGALDPVFTVMVEKHEVVDQVKKYKTEYKYDNTKLQGYSKTTREGSNGITRVTQKVQYINGEASKVYIVSSEEIKPVVNRVVTKGRGQIRRGDGEWSWPTNFPYFISSPYGYRWGKLHTGVDIAGTGRGSPIYAARAGVVYKIGYNGSVGYYVIIKHDNGYYTQYCHMQNVNGNDRSGRKGSATKYIEVDQIVEAHQVIGEVGSSGQSTGAHLHFEIWDGPPYKGQSYNPLNFY